MEKTSARKTIFIDYPLANSVISSEVRIIGRGTAFEGNIQIRISDDAGVSLAQGFASGGALGDLQPFSIELSIEAKPGTTTGCIEAFELNPRDGSEINGAVIPVIFHPNMLS